MTERTRLSTAAWCAGSGALLLMGVACALGFAPAIGYSVDQRLFDQEAVLLPGACVGQSFVSEGDGLNRLEVSLAAWGPAEATVTMQVHEGGPHGPEVRRVQRRLRAANLGLPIQRRDAFQSFAFAALEESAGKSFFFCVTLSDHEGADFLIRLHSHDVYPGGVFFHNGDPRQGDLAFRLHERRGPLARLADLIGRIAAGKPGLLASPALYAAVLLSYVGVGVAAIACVAWHCVRRSGE